MEDVRLTGREHEVLVLLAQGKQNKEIACCLNVTEHTVEYHLKNVYRKLQVANRIEAALKFLK